MTGQSRFEGGWYEGHHSSFSIYEKVGWWDLSRCSMERRPPPSETTGEYAAVAVEVFDSDVDWSWRDLHSQNGAIVNVFESSKRYFSKTIPLYKMKIYLKKMKYLGTWFFF